MGITYCIATIDPEDVEVKDLVEEDRVDFFDRGRVAASGIVHQTTAT
jgi:hypothetical protein